MRLFIFIALILVLPSAIAIDPNFEIDGLIIDQTLSRIGHLFYEELLKDWDTSNQVGTITVRERFDPITGNVIWIDVDDNAVYQERINSRSTDIEEKVQSARNELKLYLQQNKDILQNLETYK